MKQISNTSKLGRYYISRWQRSKLVRLEQAYRKPSSRKVAIFERCESEVSRVGGKDLRILGYNCDYFTVAYKLGKDLIVNTGQSRYKIELPENLQE